jgi:hypothetical protein
VKVSTAKGTTDTWTISESSTSPATSGYGWGEAAAYQGITYFIQWVIVGAAVGLIYKPS